MKLIIKSSGEESPEWPGIEYTLVAETPSYKTTIQYWGNADEFKSFTKQLKRYPFESKDDVVYRSGHWDNSGYKVTLTVHLADGVGATEMRIETDRGVSSSARFSDGVEAAGLDHLAHLLEATDFSKPIEIEWESHAEFPGYWE